MNFTYPQPPVLSLSISISLNYRKGSSSGAPARGTMDNPLGRLDLSLLAEETVPLILLQAECFLSKMFETRSVLDFGIFALYSYPSVFLDALFHELPQIPNLTLLKSLM